MQYLLAFLFTTTILLSAFLAIGQPDTLTVVQPVDGTPPAEFITGINECAPPRVVLRVLADNGKFLQIVIGDWSVFTNPDTGEFTEVIMHSGSTWCVTNAGVDHDYITRKT